MLFPSCSHKFPSRRKNPYVCCSYSGDKEYFENCKHLPAAVDEGTAYCLVPRAMFFEFLPAPITREDGSESPPLVRSRAAARAVAAAEAEGRAGRCTLLAHELEVGRDYELVCTTLGGLCRYRIGDVVKACRPIIARHRRGLISRLRRIRYR